MFGWRRKNDGFEWREYVRTTIKIRRDERAKKIDEIKEAAAEGAKAAGRQGVTAGRIGLAALGRGAVWFARRLGWWLRQGVLAAAAGARFAVAAGAAMMKRMAGGLRAGASGGWRLRLPAAPRLTAHGKIAMMFGGLALLALLSAGLQYRETGADWSAMLAALVGFILFGLALAPWLRKGWHSARSGLAGGGFRVRLPNVPIRMPPPKWSLAASLGVIVAGGMLWGWQSGGFKAASATVVSSIASLPTGSVSTKPVPASLSGRARAVTGDTLRLNGRLVRLAGMEAPELSQICRDRRNRAWRCGQRSRNTLQILVRRAEVSCSNVSAIAGGRLEATCRVGDGDVASAMVEKGYAFAEGLFFKTYASAEAKAREARLGIWQGDAQRPADFRAKRWERASQSAPDGCPIKGRVVRKAKVYVLPWAANYGQVRVRASRGERWFCSESEAIAAGFRPSSTG
ncbi:MAG: thermonuclease family protein [Alphaproteobacteria bacterium]|nr:thermonuclease family protein [Alphaproteobacteria bacterium]